MDQIHIQKTAFGRFFDFKRLTIYNKNDIPILFSNTGRRFA